MSFRMFPLLLLLPAVAAGADVSVRFDARQTIACQDVTTDEFAAARPGERLWEAKLEVSSLITGSERLLTSYFYQLDSLQQQLVFEDYLPQTTLQSRYAGNVEVSNKAEKTRNLGLAVTLDAVVKATPSAGAGSKSSSQVSYSLLPPQEQLAASGTQRRGRGVYFKLRPSTQHTLEGGKEFAVVFRAPASWRAGTMLLRCEATGVKQGLFRDEPQRAGSALLLLALYRGGDVQAQRAAQQYAAAEGRLRRAADRERAEIRRRQASDSGFRLPGASAPEAAIPAGWLERLLVAPHNDRWPRYAEHLPSSVRESGEEFLAAKHRLLGLGDEAGMPTSTH